MSTIIEQASAQASFTDVIRDRMDNHANDFHNLKRLCINLPTYAYRVTGFSPTPSVPVPGDPSFDTIKSSCAASIIALLIHELMDQEEQRGRRHRNAQRGILTESVMQRVLKGTSERFGVDFWEVWRTDRDGLQYTAMSLFGININSMWASRPRNIPIRVFALFTADQVASMR